MYRYIVLYCCWPIFTSLLLAVNDVEFQKIYFISVRCNCSEQFIHQNYSCFAKSYNRTFSTMNVIVTTKMPLSNIFVRDFVKFKLLRLIHNAQGEVKLLFRYGLVFREVISTPRMDWCKVTIQDQTRQSLENRVIFAMVKFLKASYPQAIHECPYNVA